MNLNFSPKAMAAFISRYRSALILVAVLGICGYTGYQISQVVAATPDAATIAAAEANNNSVVKFDTATINSITSHSSISAAPNLNNLGTANPFFAQ